MTQEVHYMPHRALCSDGKTRTARVRSYWDGRSWSFHCDTFFSTPAWVWVKDRKVRGYVTVESRDGYQTATEEDPAVLKFFSYKYLKNGAMLP